MQMLMSVLKGYSFTGYSDFKVTYSQLNLSAQLANTRARNKAKKILVP